MKKTMKMFTAAALIFCAVSCTGKAGEPVFDSISDSETFRQGPNDFELDYRFEYLSDYSDRNVLEKIRQGMITDFFGEDYANRTPEAAAAAYRDFMTSGFNKEVADFRDNFPEAYPWNWFMKVRSHQDVPGGHVIAYTVETSYYMGGAHGMETVEYSNYDLRTGNRLTLDDIFTPQGKEALAGRIHDAILENHNANDWEALMEGSCYAAMDEVQPTENFLLSEEHIAFVYNPYDIACYAQGRTKVKIPLNGLEGFRKEVLEK